MYERMTCPHPKEQRRTTHGNDEITAERNTIDVAFSNEFYLFRRQSASSLELFLSFLDALRFSICCNKAGSQSIFAFKKIIKQKQ